MKFAATVLLIHPETNQCVLVNRRNSTQVGLPGGKVDEGELPIYAALRELREETGIIIDESRVDVLYEEVCHGDVDYHTTTFLGYYDGVIPGGEESDIIAHWGSMDDLLTNSPFSDYNIGVLKELDEFIAANRICE